MSGECLLAAVLFSVFLIKERVWPSRPVWKRPITRLTTWYLIWPTCALVIDSQWMTAEPAVGWPLFARIDITAPVFLDTWNLGCRSPMARAHRRWCVIWSNIRSAGTNWLMITSGTVTSREHLPSGEVFCVRLFRHPVTNGSVGNNYRRSQPAAVGDPIAVVFDAKRDQAKAVVRWKGTPYYPVQSGVTALPEYNALKVGMDDSGKIWLYQEKRPTQENEIIVKIGANQFLRLAPK